jgi:hypothetical protein
MEKEPYIIPIEGERETGKIYFNYRNNTWRLTDSTDHEVDTIDADAFPTIFDFKQWAKEKLDAWEGFK